MKKIVAKEFFVKKGVEGMKMPFWYGVFYYNIERREVVLLPIPINIVAGLARELFWRIKVGVWKSAKIKVYNEAWAIGYQKGYAKGFNNGAANKVLLETNVFGQRK